MNTITKEALIKQKLKKEDQLNLPIDDAFFEQMHTQIMQAVEKTEVKQLNRWAKTWVFLEKSSRHCRPAIQQTARAVFVLFVAFLSVGLAVFSYQQFDKSQVAMMSENQNKILNELKLQPEVWLELAASAQNDSDFYNDLMIEKLSYQNSLDLLKNL